MISMSIYSFLNMNEFNVLLLPASLFARLPLQVEVDGGCNGRLACIQKTVSALESAADWFVELSPWLFLAFSGVEHSKLRIPSGPESLPLQT
jgi:hypothetical protein